MPEFNAVENTLFIPMLGRIYASEHFQNILYDEKALSLKDALPKSLVETGSQNQYTLLASAFPFRQYGPIYPGLPPPQTRRRNCGTGVRVGDHLLQERRWAYPLVCSRSAGCNGISKDAAPGTGTADILCRRCLFRWLDQADSYRCPDAPVLVTVGGLFHYFEEKTVLALLRMLQTSEIWRSCSTV